MADLFLDLFQNRAIRKNTLAAGRASRKAGAAQRSVRDLEAEVDRLNLVAFAMWELLQDHTGATDEQLIEKVRSVDLHDGHRNNRAKPPPIDCPECGRTINARHVKCLYCDAEISTSPFGK